MDSLRGSRYQNDQNNLKVYQMAPIGKSLTDTISKLNRPDLQQIIIDKFEKVIEDKFEEIPASTMRSTCVGKNKLQADAESYNNVYQVWKFRITKFNCILDEKEFKN